MDPVLGGRFRIGSRIGSGSTGDVYVATDLETDTPVAVKVLQRAGAPEALAEVRRLEQCRHPNVLAYYGSGIEEDGPFAGAVWLATDLADESLADLVDQHGGRVPWDLLRPIVVQLLRGLAYLHTDQGIVHRDIKPDNVLAVGDVWRVADLGLAAPSAPGGGALDYLAPEVRAGGAASPASDLWSVGVLIVRCCSGALPSDGRVPDGLPHEAQRLATALLEQDALDRPGSASAALRLLAADTAAVGAGGGARFESPTAHRTRRIVAAGVAVLLVLALGTAAVAAGGGTHGRSGGGATSSSSSTPPRQERTAGVAPVPPDDEVAASGSTCRNEFLGYRLELPAGWYARPGDRRWDDCQVLSDHPFGGKGEVDPEAAPIVFERLPPEFPKYTPVSTETISVSGIQSTFEELGDIYNDGEVRGHVALIPLGPSTLVGSLLSTPHEPAASYRRKVAAFRLVLDSLVLVDSVCIDRRDIRCGSFFWSHDPPPNAPLTLTAVPDRASAVVGQPIVVHAEADDPDADVVQISQIPRTGTAATYSCGQTLPRTDGYYYRQRTEPPGGAWDPPAPGPAGHASKDVTLSFDQPGTYRLCFRAFSTSSDAIDGHDPYGSSSERAVVVEVAEAPAATGADGGSASTTSTGI
jgi:hypothetical protein